MNSVLIKIFCVVIVTGPLVDITDYSGDEGGWILLMTVYINHNHDDGDDNVNNIILDDDVDKVGGSDGEVDRYNVDDRNVFLIPRKLRK